MPFDLERFLELPDDVLATYAAGVGNLLNVHKALRCVSTSSCSVWRAQDMDVVAFLGLSSIERGSVMSRGKRVVTTLGRCVHAGAFQQCPPAARKITAVGEVEKHEPRRVRASLFRVSLLASRDIEPWLQ